MVASCSIGRPGHTLIHAVRPLTKFSLIMRAIIDFQNLSPALKDAMLTYNRAPAHRTPDHWGLLRLR
jgi:hypothetical protein